MNKVIFTSHARDRLAEIEDMPLKKAVWGLHNKAVEEKLEKGLRKGKKDGDSFRYYRWGSIIYSTVETTDKITGEDIVLVVTITDQKATIKHKRWSNM